MHSEVSRKTMNRTESYFGADVTRRTLLKKEKKSDSWASHFTSLHFTSLQYGPTIVILLHQGMQAIELEMSILWKGDPLTTSVVHWDADGVQHIKYSSSIQY